MSSKKVRGYIFSRRIGELFIPQQVQNLVIRDFCKNNNFLYMLSSVEYKMKDSFLMLQGILKELSLIDGIVMYSAFQFPSDEKKRKEIFEIILKKSKFICFALENIKISKSSEVSKFESIYKINQLLKYCPQKFTYGKEA